MNYKETIKACEKFEFNEQITREMIWYTAYALGRSRWYWGPRWMSTFRGWLNTQLQSVFK